jgi:hypothetical protein
MAREDPQFKLRMTEDLKAAIERSAAANNRSMNAEIVARLDGSISKEAFEIWLPPELRERIEAEANRSEAEPNLLVVEALEKAFPQEPPTLGKLVEMLKKAVDNDREPVSEEIRAYLTGAELLIQTDPRAAHMVVTPSSLDRSSAQRRPWDK